MVRIVTSEAVILRTVPWRATSKQVTAFTRNFGKVLLIAKGGRRPGSKFGAALEKGVNARIIFYRSQTRPIHTLSDAEILDYHQRMRQRPGGLSSLALMIKFIERNFELEVPRPTAFRLVQQTLAAIDQTELEPVSLAFACLFGLAELAGCQPCLDHCVVCRRKAAAFFAPRLGGILCARCRDLEPGAMRVSSDDLSCLQRLRGSVVMGFPSVQISGYVQELIARFLSNHFEAFSFDKARGAREPRPCPPSSVLPLDQVSSGTRDKALKPTQS